jgi:predicted nucleic acid-binding protein
VIVVADAGPLIALAAIGQFDLLHLLYGQLHIPSAVRDEVIASGKGRPGERAVRSADWIRTVEVDDTTAVQHRTQRRDAGESEAIVLAIQLGADLLLMDEARGRRVAEGRGLNRTGTIGTLIAAKKQGLVISLTPIPDELIAAGFRMSEDLYRTARALSGEA